MENLWHIISKPDNVPIIGLMVLLVFFHVAGIQSGI